MNRMINKVIKLMKKTNYLISKDEEIIYRIIMKSHCERHKHENNGKNPSVDWLLNQQYPIVSLREE